MSAHGCWRFEGFRLEESSRLLTAPDGQVIELDRSAFLVLQYLLLHAGQLCTHDELLLAGWPQRRVQASSVFKCISRLREWLQDEAGERIRLTHGYGYLLSMRCSYQPGSGLLDPPPAMPTPGSSVPGRPDWIVVQGIGQGATGEVYIARHEGGLPPRAYKFATEERGLRGLKREVALQHFLWQEYPDFDDLLPIVDTQLEVAPYFLATPLQVQGNLLEWSRQGNRLLGLSRAARLDLAIALCEAVARLHAVEIAHRDLKPQNLYVLEQASGFRVLLADLGAGAGLLPPGVDRSGVPIGQLTREGVPEEGSGPERYLAPELLAGAAATMQSDLYALGLLVYQIMVADFHRVLAPAWERLLADPLLAADIAAAANQDPGARPASARVLADRLKSLEQRRAVQVEAARLDALSQELARTRARAARRLQLMLVGVIVALLATGGLLASLKLYRDASVARDAAEQARQQAEREARTARAVLSFLNDTLLGQTDPWSVAAGNVESKTMLRRASQGIDERFSGEAASAAAVHEAVADAWEGWGDYTEAMRHSRRALDLLATLEAPMPLQRADRLRKLCRQARMAQRLDQSESACAAAQAIEQASAGRVGPELTVELAKLRFEQGRCRETLDLTGALLKQTVSTEPEWLRDARWFRGICFGRFGEFRSAREEFDRLMAMNWDPSRRHAVMLRAWVEMDFAEMLIAEGDFTAAGRLVESADRVFGSLLSAEHPDYRLADYQRARMALWSHDLSRARSLYRGVVDSWTATLGGTHLWTLYAETELLLAELQGGFDPSQGPRWRRQFEQLRQRTLPQLESRLPQRSFFGEIWAWTALKLGDHELALARIAQARADLAAAMPAGHPRHGSLDCAEALIWQERKDSARARPPAARCRQALDALPVDNGRRRWIEGMMRTAGR